MTSSPGLQVRRAALQTRTDDDDRRRRQTTDDDRRRQTPATVLVLLLAVMLTEAPPRTRIVRLKGKGFPYSSPSVGPGADPGVQAISPQVTDYKSFTRR